MTYIAPITEEERLQKEKEEGKVVDAPVADATPNEAPVAEEVPADSNVADKLTGFFNNILQK
jgi:hypothetical protein